MSTSTILRENIGGWGRLPTLTAMLAARTFGVMVELAAPVVVNYHSDLYHDAFTIRDTFERAGDVTELVINFAVRANGTFLGETARLHATHWPSETTLYRLTLHADERWMWHLTIEKV